MPKVYTSLIIKGMKTINDVPENIRENVRQLLIEMGDSELAQELQ